MTPTLRLRIDGPRGCIVLGTFLALADNTARILGDLDPALSGQPRGSVDWVVSDLGAGSLVVDLQARPRRDAPTGSDVGARVARVLVEGLAHLERESSTPPYFSDVALKRARRLSRLLVHDRAASLVLSDARGEAVLSPRAAGHIAPLLATRRTALGSVEGQLGLIAVYARPRFRVYEVGTHRAVTCAFGPAVWPERVKDALGRRVNAYGLVTSNLRGEPLRVELQDLRILGDRADLPQLDEIGGSDPALTGALSTKEYIQSIRGG